MTDPRPVQAREPLIVDAEWEPMLRRADDSLVWVLVVEDVHGDAVEAAYKRITVGWMGEA